MHVESLLKFLTSLTFPLMIAGAIFAVVMYLRKQEQKYLLLLMTIVFAFILELGEMYFLTTLTVLSQFRLDQYFYAIDAWFGQPSYVVGRLMREHWWLDFFGKLAYSSIIEAIVVVAGYYCLTQPLEKAKTVVRSLMCMLVALPLYIAIPASGPAYAFAGFPYSMAPVDPHPIYLRAYPNCFPSLHFASALLMAVFMWDWKPGKVLGAGFVIFTAISTLGLGEHYFIDLIASVPVVLFSLWAGSNEA
jgi:hypothetical protein